MTAINAPRKRWSYNEHLLAMNLYCKLPFGKLHQRTPEIIELAQILGRTPASVAMKLCNFASLDSELQARGIKGLSGISADAIAIWEEFHRDWNRLAAMSEALMESVRTDQRTLTEVATDNGNEIFHEPEGASEQIQSVRVRRTQRFFRSAVLASYNYHCCITGIPLPQLLIASHILPWAKFPEHRTNPQNGLCLSRLYDAAFDAGLVTFDDNYRLVISMRIKDHFNSDALKCHFAPYEGSRLIVPEKFPPDPTFLAHHREQCFEKR